MEGTVLKDQNGYFTILGNNQVLTRCRSRGALKKKTDVLVGDHVEYETNKGFEGIITKVYKRKNQLYRPPVSNVDELVLVSSICTPDLNRGLLDKMILLAENAMKFLPKEYVKNMKKRDIPVFIHLHILKMALTI